jgi:Plasmid pRiA4b ORF-3-like protein
LKVTLRGSKPPIWRRLEVTADSTLDELHEVLQAAFGWDGSHLYVFEAGGRQYGEPDPELDFESMWGVKLSRLAPVGGRLRYTYDFGDDWEH